MTPGVTPRAVALYRAHPGTAAVAAWLMIGLTAGIGALVGFAGAVELEGWLQRRAAS